MSFCRVCGHEDRCHDQRHARCRVCGCGRTHRVRRIVSSWLRGWWPRRRYWLAGRVIGDTPIATPYRKPHPRRVGDRVLWRTWAAEPADLTVEMWGRPVVGRTMIGTARMAVRRYNRALADLADVVEDFVASRSEP